MLLLQLFYTFDIISKEKKLSGRKRKQLRRRHLNCIIEANFTRWIRRGRGRYVESHRDVKEHDLSAGSSMCNFYVTVCLEYILSNIYRELAWIFINLMFVESYCWKFKKCLANFWSMFMPNKAIVLYTHITRKLCFKYPEVLFLLGRL